MTLLNLIRQFGHKVYADGAAGVQTFSPSTLELFDEVKRRYEAAFTSTDDTVPASAIRQILDGER